MKKILIACPTASAKNYCFQEWIANTMSFTYPNYEVVVFDNTDDGGENAQHLNDTFKRLYGNSDKFKAFHSKVSGVTDIFQKIAISSNEMRDYFLSNKEYYAMLCLESDVFPQADVIELLMLNRKQVCGALYFRDEGQYRKLMIQNMVRVSPVNMKSFNMVAGDEAVFVDGTLKKVASVGLGCILISRPVLQKIKFRYILGSDCAPDTFFSEDVHQNGWSIFADTSLICRHQSQSWDIYKKIIS